MKMLTLLDVLRLHERIIQQSGGSFGVRNRDAVASALLQASITFDGEELYPDLLDKVAVTGFLLIANHPVYRWEQTDRIRCDGGTAGSKRL